MNNRHQRRADLAAFRKSAGELNTFLIGSDDQAALDREPMFARAALWWSAGIERRKPTCICCRRSFLGVELEVGAYLFAVPVAAPTSCSVSGICLVCWQTLPDSEVEANALRVLRKIVPHGRFEGA